LDRQLSLLYSESVENKNTHCSERDDETLEELVVQPDPPSQGQLEQDISQ